MEIRDNFNIFNLFLDKHVKIYVDNKFFRVRVLTIREFCVEETYNAMYHMWTLPSSQIEKILPISTKTSFELVHNILFQMGIYKEFSSIATTMVDALEFFLPELKIDYQNKQLIVDNITITEDIWEYVLYVLRLSCGEKVEKPRTFASEDERQFYLAQKKMDEKIKKIKSQNPGDSEGLIKSFLTIQYKFNLSFDYLAEQTVAQIQWLQKYAAGAVSYEVNAQAFAAGNMKKGKKLDFFIK